MNAPSPRSLRGRRKSRTASSAAAFAGVIGLPDPGHGPHCGDGGLYAFARQFNAAADRYLYHASPESRAFVHAERAAAICRPC